MSCDYSVEIDLPLKILYGRTVMNSSTYVEGVERHLEVKFNNFKLSINVVILCAKEQHVWNAEQRYKNES